MVALAVVGAAKPFEGPFQAPAAAIWWLWSFRRLWVAVISRHSDLAADLPRRPKRSMRRLNRRMSEHRLDHRLATFL
jgi:hypothetical protein